jgi:hypothetical protein
MMRNPGVTAIIINFNRPEETHQCILSLINSTYPNLDILVVNVTEFPIVTYSDIDLSKVQILHIPENLGYAGNNNFGIKHALENKADWIFLLNDDTSQEPDCLEKLMDVAVKNHSIGILGPMVYHFDEPSVIQSAGGILDKNWFSYHRGMNEEDRGQYSHQSQEVDFINGCALLLKREVIDDIGFLDERFFLYWEETEWCYRAKISGWHVIHVPEAKLWHKGVTRNYNPQPFVTYYTVRNRLLMMSIHKAPVSAWIHTWFSLVQTCLSWTIRPRWKSKHIHRNALVKAIFDYLKKRWGNTYEYKKGTISQVSRKSSDQRGNAHI